MDLAAPPISWITTVSTRLPVFEMAFATAVTFVLSHPKTDKEYRGKIGIAAKTNQRFVHARDIYRGLATALLMHKGSGPLNLSRNGIYNFIRANNR
jgi:hypothetical protein